MYDRCNMLSDMLVLNFISFVDIRWFFFTCNNDWEFLFDVYYTELGGYINLLNTV